MLAKWVPGGCFICLSQTHWGLSKMGAFLQTIYCINILPDITLDEFCVIHYYITWGRCGNGYGLGSGIHAAHYYPANISYGEKITSYDPLFFAVWWFDKWCLITLFHIGHRFTSIFYITGTSNDRHGVSNYRSFECLFNSLLRLTTKKHHRSALLSLCDRWIPRTKGQ